MGDFANTLFSVLLGWIRTAAEWLWSVTGSQSNGGMIGWIGENWLTLIVIVCAAGLLMDFFVHMLRWKPYKVWASFFRRLTGRTGRDEPSDSGRLRRQWIYADGTTEYDEIPLDEEPQAMAPLPLQPQSAPAVQEMYAEPEPVEEYRPTMDYSPYARPVDQPAPVIPEMQEEIRAELPQEEPESMARPVRNAARRRRYIPLQEEDDMPLRYAPPPAAEEAPAYNAPYIPPQWKKPSSAGATTNTLDDGGIGL